MIAAMEPHTPDPNSLEREDDQTALSSDLEQPYGAYEPMRPLKPQRSRRLRYLPIVIGLLVALLLAGGIFAGITLQKRGTKVQKTVVINTQSLDNGTLNQLKKQTDTKAVTPQLTITPNTIFEHDVNIQGSEAVKNDLVVNGNATIAKNTTVGGNLTVRGQITGSSLAVGSVTFGTLTVTNTITFGSHLIPQGSTPTAVASVAAAGGTVAVSGNDTAGTVTITMGNGPVLAGELAIVTFKTPFATTPKVQLTPINQASSELHYFASRSATFFTVNTGNAPVAGASDVFDYFVTQ